MRFEFRLRRVLDLARVLEQKKQSQLNQARKRIQELSGMLQDARTESESLLADQVKSPTSPLGQLRYHRVQTLRDLGLRLESTIVEFKSSLKKLTEELNRLVLRRKGLEALRDHRYREFRKTQRRKEQRQMDEVSLRGFIVEPKE